MSNPAAFRATYSDWKLVRTRKVVQIVFEVPVEAADAAYKVVGGMPDSGSETWFAIARLKPETEVMPNPDTPGLTEDSGQHNATPRPAETEQPDGAKSWNTLRPSQQAGILCSDTAFWKFLSEGVRTSADRIGGGRGWSRKVASDSEAAEAVRYLCIVNSRADIGLKNDSGERWREVVSLYRAWVHEPEYVA